MKVELNTGSVMMSIEKLKVKYATTILTHRPIATFG